MTIFHNFFPIAFVTLALFPVLAKADNFLYTSLPVKLPLPSLFLMLAVLIPVVIKRFTQKVGEPFSKTYQNTLLIIFPFLLIALITTLWGLHPGANWDFGYRFLLMDLYHWILLIVAIALAHSEVIRKNYHTIFLIALLGASAAIWTDIVYPGTFGVLETRAAGFAGNSNWGGRIIIFLAIAAVQWEKNSLLNLLIFTIAGLSVFATLSMGCLMLYLMILTLYLVLKLKQLKGEHFLMKVTMIPATLLLIVFIVQPVMLNLMNSSEAFSNKNSQERIDELLNFTQGDFSFAADHERTRLVTEYWELISESPLIGKGTGFSMTRTYRPHNLYIKHWVENGLLGLISILVFIACAFLHFWKFKNTQGMVLIFMFFMSGFFDHNLIQYKTFVVLVGILGAIAYLDQSKHSDIARPQTEITGY